MGSHRYLKVDPCVILNVLKTETTFIQDNMTGLTKKNNRSLLFGAAVTSTLGLLLVPTGSPLCVFDE